MRVLLVRMRVGVCVPGERLLENGLDGWEVLGRHWDWAGMPWRHTAPGATVASSTVAPGLLASFRSGQPTGWASVREAPTPSWVVVSSHGEGRGCTTGSSPFAPTPQDSPRQAQPRFLFLKCSAPLLSAQKEAQTPLCDLGGSLQHPWQAHPRWTFLDWVVELAHSPAHRGRDGMGRGMFSR